MSAKFIFTYVRARLGTVAAGIDLIKTAIVPPSVGLSADIGSQAYSSSTGQVWTKTGAPDTSWTELGPARYSPPEKWVQNNVAASQTNVALSTLVSTNFDDIRMIRAGSIVGLSTRLTEAVTLATANALVVKVSKNGTPGTLSVVSTSGSNPSGGQSTQAAGVDTFVAGDAIGIVISTLAGFTPITTDIEAWIEVQT